MVFLPVEHVIHTTALQTNDVEAVCAPIKAVSHGIASHGEATFLDRSILPIVVRLSRSSKVVIDVLHLINTIALQISN
jgi:hypothetical protein